MTARDAARVTSQSERDVSRKPFRAYFLGWGSTQTGQKWHLRLDGANGVMCTEFMGGQNFATTNVIDDEWHHFASVFPEVSFEGGDILHYLDGELDPQAGGTSIPIETAIGEGLADWTKADSGFEPYYVHFGAVLGHGFDRQLDGSMADVRIYDDGLSQERIQAIFEGRDTGGVGGAPRLLAGDADNNIFKATFGSSFGSLTFGNVARTGLSEDFLLNDLTVIGSLAGGGDLGAVDLVYVPEPRTVVLAVLGLLSCLAHRRR